MTRDLLKTYCTRVVVAVMCLVTSSCSTAPPPTPISLAQQAITEGRIEEAERILEPMAGVRDRQVYEAIDAIQKSYDDTKKLPFSNAEKSLFWLLKLANHPLHRQMADIPGYTEAQIGSQYLEGRGTTRNIEQGCLWTEKSYNLREVSYVLKALADNCRSLTTITDMDDPTKVQWLAHYTQECRDGRRVRPKFRECRKARLDVEDCVESFCKQEGVSLEDFRRRQSGGQ